MNIIDILGGPRALLAGIINGLIDRNLEGIDAAADRAVTLPEKDVRWLCDRFGVEREHTDRRKVLEEFRRAADHLGNALAILVRWGARSLVK
ncbi:MAG: hypothetical protein MH204_08285 [Fimbriimonadaceae bacterium]|nr:hypothetical protein [Fimbriimonadaceae bacterium]